MVAVFPTAIGCSGVPTISSGFRRVRDGEIAVGVAVESVFAVSIARLNLDEADVQDCVPVRIERERAGDVDRADDGLGLRVVDDTVPRADEHAGTRAGNRVAVPSRGVGPLAALRGADYRFGRVGKRREGDQRKGESVSHGRDTWGRGTVGG